MSLSDEILIAGVSARVGGFGALWAASSDEFSPSGRRGTEAVSQIAGGLGAVQGGRPDPEPAQDALPRRREAGRGLD